MSNKMLTDDILALLGKTVSDGSGDRAFNLSDEACSSLLDLFNIKVCKVENGFLCFQGHKVGSGARATSSGAALGLFLRSHGCRQLSSEEELTEFCSKLIDL